MPSAKPGLEVAPAEALEVADDPHEEDEGRRDRADQVGVQGFFPFLDDSMQAIISDTLRCWETFLMIVHFFSCPPFR